jgi:hypothetical protein
VRGVGGGGRVGGCFDCYLVTLCVVTCPTIVSTLLYRRPFQWAPNKRVGGRQNGSGSGSSFALPGDKVDSGIGLRSTRA